MILVVMVHKTIILQLKLAMEPKVIQLIKKIRGRCVHLLVCVGVCALEGVLVCMCLSVIVSPVEGGGQWSDLLEVIHSRRFGTLMGCIL